MKGFIKLNDSECLALQNSFNYKILTEYIEH